MTIYYAVLKDVNGRPGYEPNKEFNSDREAVDYFQNKYGTRLDSVIRDEYPAAKVVFDSSYWF